MRSILFFCLLSLFFHACGSEGDKRKPHVPVVSDDGGDDDEEELSLRTSVGLNPLAYEFPFLTSCLQRFEGTGLVQLDADWHPDGGADDWAEAAAAWPAQANLDAASTKAYFGNSATVVGGWIDVAEPQLATVQLEFGGVVVSQKKLQPNILRMVELAPGNLSELRDGIWQPMDPGDIEVIRSDAGIEIAISKRFLGETIAHPSWWIRVVTVTPAGLASTHAAYFPNLITSDTADFTFLGCQAWTTQPKPFSMFHLQDSARAAPGFPMVSVAERAYQLTRLAYDAVHSLGDDISMPMAATTVIATRADTTPMIGKISVVDDAADLFGSLRINVNSLGPDSVAAFPQGKVFSQAAMFFLDAYLYQENRELHPLLRLAIGRALLDKAQAKFLTPQYYLDYFGTDTATFLDQFDAGKPDAVGPLMSADLNDSLAREKALALGNLLAILVKTEDLLAGWQALEGSGDPERFKEVFGIHLTAIKQQDRWAGWLSDRPYAAGLSPQDLRDQDFDGLPDAMEAFIGSSPTESDTDKDGWSDYSEWLLGHQPNNAGEWPKVVVPDGLFTDWFTLFPQRVHSDKGRSSACPGGADITHFAALATQDHLIIAAHAKDYDPNHPRAMWQALINAPKEGKSVLVVAEGHSRQLVVKDPKSGTVLRRFQRAMPMGNDTVEWLIDRRDFGFKTYFDLEENIRVQIVTGYKNEKDGDQFCDQTEWFTPYIYEKG